MMNNLSSKELLIATNNEKLKLMESEARANKMLLSELYLRIQILSTPKKSRYSS